MANILAYLELVQVVLLNPQALATTDKPNCIKQPSALERGEGWGPGGGVKRRNVEKVDLIFYRVKQVR